ncbi:MAG: hypothetical protein QQN63_14465, partial [Nitrosopumilus sp.]
MARGAVQHKESGRRRKPVDWTASADLILDRVKRPCERSYQSPHWRFEAIHQSGIRNFNHL